MAGILEGLSLLGNGGNGLVNTANQAFGSGLQNSANLKLAKYQYSNELDMWNKANAYNTPAAQMQRFKDAGLNPNLIYGQGNSGNTANVLPRYQAPSIRADIDPANNVPNMLSAYQDFRVKDAQVDNIKAQTDSVRNESIIRALNAKWLSGRNEWDLDPDYGNFKAKNMVNRQEANLKVSQASILNATIQDQIRKIQLANQQAESMIPQIRARTENIGLLNQYQSGMNKLYNVSQGASIAQKVLPTLLRILGH
jgi:hypothetical protein|nr:MAG: DNA pilot protein [Microviridae sp.]